MNLQSLEEELKRLQAEQENSTEAGSGHPDGSWYIDQLKMQVGDEQFNQLAAESSNVDEFLLKLNQAKAERALKSSSS